MQMWIFTLQQYITASVFPTDLFTPIFAISRASGWTAQVLEQLDDNRLYRPLTDYTGQDSQPEILPIDERS